MASVIKETRGGRTLYRVQWRDGDKQRRSMRLSGCTLKDTQYIAGRVQALVGCQVSGRGWDTDLAAWVRDIGDDLADKLADQGLIERRLSATLRAFVDGYIASRTEVAPNTAANWTRTRIRLVKFFGDSRDLRTITPGDADAWRQSMVDDKLAPATISRTVKNARQFFKAAVRQRLVHANPFADLKAGGERDDTRKVFVTCETIDKVLDAANTEWQTIIALCRFGGLRCPTEVLALEWDHIDWAGGKFTVTSPKTRHQGKPYRTVPLFPELRPYLEASHAIAPDGARFVVARYRDASTNLRTQFLRILRRAGVEPWERLFQNLRASRETELANKFPLHVVTAWLGNTPTVATQHYLTVTEEHFEQALVVPEVVQGVVQGVVQQVVQQPVATSGASRNEQKENTEKTSVSRIFPVITEPTEYALEDSNL